ncbi:MAG: electron transfer flavoprotein subunit beta/FixA family protein [Synergistetes bacterium]|nr:MAG: Electron transfer flavoprotein alpha/beta-subunit [bacterium 42_11]MBC7332092.1 electron transfer flavoprotein subunit beta/FixA family protein [Synergistota bacterium]MDK2870725.1 electron transfer flavoprotein beta subunit [bacterium]
MRICVLVKQVPATDKVKMDEKTGTMIRTEMEAELNPLDMYAVEEAVRVKERLGGNARITVISMGPLMAVDAVKDAISMGCDEGYLLSDKLLAGSDTWATAYALSGAIRYLGGFDLIFCGERATDGETGQVGPSVASWLNIPALTYVSKIERLEERYIRVRRAVEGGYEVVETELPVLLSVVKEINEPRLPNLAGKLRAKEMQIPVLTVDDLNLNRSFVGLEGSPTRVVKIFYPKLSRNGKIISGKNPEEAVDELISFLESKGIL